jgi:hypothetical protein
LQPSDICRFVLAPLPGATQFSCSVSRTVFCAALLKSKKFAYGLAEQALEY